MGTRIQKSRAGFTIVELLIVIVVIGILAAITIVAYNGIQSRAKLTALQSDLKSASKILEKNKFENAANGSEKYPDTGTVVNSLLKLSNGITFDTSADYLVNNVTNPSSYCLTLTSGTTDYSITNKVSGPVLGTCVTNLAVNPGTEVDTLGWASRLSASVSRVTTQQHSDLAALQVVTPGTVADEGVNMGTATGVTASGLAGNHTGSAWVKGTAGVALVMFVEDYTSAGTYVKGTRVDFTATGGWQRVSGIVNLAAAGSKVAVNVRTNTAIATTYYVDDAMVVAGSTNYSYGSGDTSGWFWNGTANASSSTGPAVAQ